MSADEHRIGSRGGGIRQAIKDFFFGAVVYGLYQQVVYTKVKYRDIFYTLIMGEFLGIPLLGNYFTLGLIPYIYGDFMATKKRLLRDVDILELLHEGPAVH